MVTPTLLSVLMLLSLFASSWRPVTEPSWPGDCQESDGVTNEARDGGCDVPLAGAFREGWFYSPTLGRTMPYLVYLPPDYDASGRAYPVLYLLHGGSANKGEWVGVGLIH